MGIQGLLPLLKSIHKATHLRNFAGQTIGVDAYGWLHRGTVSCAIELAQQQPTRKHIDFALNRVRMLIHFGVKPYIVFDGDYLPSKAHTEKERAAKRKESKRVGLQLLQMGRTPQALLELQKAIDVTPLMARELIEELRQLGVPYTVAPYEADSQLAYLEKKGIISGVISEDSDLLVFGVKRLLTKLDQHGECIMINREHFTACREISLVGWTDMEFRMMAMLSGCDYLPGIDKLGLKTAYRLVRQHKTIQRIVRIIQFDGKMKVPPGYLEAFTRAERTFLYQWVFCTEAQCLTNLNAIPSDLSVEEMPYIGKAVEAEVAIAVAAGDLEPSTKQPLVVARKEHLPAARTRSVNAPYEKQGQPISDFFKPKRTPLAELDPNSFTPSPSQQRLLATQQTTSWSASQTPTARMPAVHHLSSVLPPLLAPQSTRRTVSDQWPTGRRSSPKRQRLCSDNILAACMPESASATSRFFSESITDPSSLTRKASNRKHEEFDLWSDDSVVDAIAELPTMKEAPATVQTPSPNKRKKLGVFDHLPAVPDLEGSETTAAAADIPPQTCVTGSLGRSQNLTGQETSATSFESGNTELKGSVFSRGVDPNFVQKSKGLHRPPAGVSRTRSEPELSRASLVQTKRDELLGRLGELPEPNKNMQETVPSSSPITSLTQGAEDIEDGEWLAMEQRHASPSLVRTNKGSEDMLVPNSPGSDGDDGRHRPKIDLGRFAFPGQL